MPAYNSMTSRPTYITKAYNVNTPSRDTEGCGYKTIIKTNM